MIWRQVRRGWIRRALAFMRMSRLGAYLCIAFAGVFAIVYPPASVAEATGPGRVVQTVWAGLMVASALSCAYGAWAERWVGEWVGLIPLAFVAAVFAISALSRGQVGLAGGLFLFGFFWLLVARWQEVALLRAEADRQATNGHGEEREATDRQPEDGAEGRP